LVDELLDVNRLQSKQVALRLEDLDLAALATEAASWMQPQLARALRSVAAPGGAGAGAR
jgi:hypothetical protein